MTDLGPAAGHQFHFSVRVQGSYSVVGDPRHYDSDPDTISEPFTLTVRAWCLSEACQVAAQTPFGLWTQPCEDEPKGILTQSDLAERFGIGLATVGTMRDRFGPTSDLPFPRPDSPTGVVPYWNANRWPELEQWRKDQLARSAGIRGLQLPEGYVSPSGVGAWIGRSGTWVRQAARGDLKVTEPFPAHDRQLVSANRTIDLWRMDRREEIRDWHAQQFPKRITRTRRG